MALAGCMAPPAERIAHDTLVRLMDAEIQSLDPQKAGYQTNVWVATDQFAGLMAFDGRGVPQPALAESMTVSADGLTWRFTLKPGLRFSDGRPIDARVFETGWRRLKDPATAAQAVGIFEPVRSIVATGPATVAVTLHHPLPQLPELLAHPALAALPVHRIEAAGDRWTADRPLVTSGPYRATEWTLNERITLTPNPHWQGDRPAIARVVWKPVSDMLTSLRLFGQGSADIVTGYPTSRAPGLKQRWGEAVRNGPMLGIYYYTLNTTRPPFNDIRIRRAVNMAIDRERIAHILLGVGELPAWGLLPPGIGGLGDWRPDWAGWPRERRIAEARRLMAAAGHGPDRPLELTLRFPSETDHRRVAIAVAEMLKPAGVRMRLHNSEATTHRAALRSGDFTIARASWVGDYSAPENFLSAHRSTASGLNYSRYANPRYDAALDRALAIAEPAARAAAMRATEMILMDDMPIVPIYFESTRNLVSGRVRGWHDNMLDMHPSYSLAMAGQ